MIRDEFVIEMAEFMIETDGGTIDYTVPKVWIIPIIMVIKMGLVNIVKTRTNKKQCIFIPELNRNKFSGFQEYK